jgi:hypothetical protein
MYTFRFMIHVALSPCFFSPCWCPFAPLSYPPLLTWNPPCCDRIRPPWSQVACKLTPPSLTLPAPSPFQIPSTTTSRLRLLLSGTFRYSWVNFHDLFFWNGSTAIFHQAVTLRMRSNNHRIGISDQCSLANRSMRRRCFRLEKIKHKKWQQSSSSISSSGESIIEVQNQWMRLICSCYPSSTEKLLTDKPSKLFF